MGSLTNTSPGGPTGLVRNVSLPVLSYGVPVSPGPTHPRVPRVSSFSRIVKLAAAPMYRPSDEDEDADGMVPDLEPHEDLLEDAARRRRTGRPRANRYHGEVEGGSVTDFDECDGEPRVHGRAPFGEEGFGSGGEEAEGEHAQMLRRTRAVSAPPSALYVTSSSLYGDASLLGRVRCVILQAITSLHIFVPPGSRASALGTPDVEAKFLFVSTLSVMISLSAFLFAFFLPVAHPLLVAAAAIAFAPFAGRLSGSLPLATGVCACGVIAYAVAAARLASPVLLVWTSLVPVLAFAALGTRAGVAASLATAAAVFAVDSSATLPDGRISPVGVIAAWVLFLGCTGVVQTQIRKAKMGDERAGGSARWTDDGSCEEECSVGRGWGGMERNFGEAGRWEGGGDAEVPDAGVIPRGHGRGY